MKKEYLNWDKNVFADLVNNPKFDKKSEDNNALFSEIDGRIKGMLKIIKDYGKEV